MKCEHYITLSYLTNVCLVVNTLVMEPILTKMSTYKDSHIFFFLCVWLFEQYIFLLYLTVTFLPAAPPLVRASTTILKGRMMTIQDIVGILITAVPKSCSNYPTPPCCSGTHEFFLEKCC